jgi:hypothetical protein
VVIPVRSPLRGSVARRRGFVEMNPGGTWEHPTSNIEHPMSFPLEPKAAYALTRHPPQSKTLARSREYLAIPGKFSPYVKERLKIKKEFFTVIHGN